MFSLLLIGSEAVRVILFDAEMNPPDNVQVDLRLPAGTPFATTLAAAEQVVDAAYAMNEQLPGESIAGVSVLAGNIVSSRTGTEESNGSHLAGVRVHLNERPTRQAAPAEIERAWRLNIGELPHLERMEFQTTRLRPRPSVAYALKHNDAETLGKAAAGRLRDRRQPVARQAAPGDPAHPGRGSGGTDAGRHRVAIARQLPRRGGPAHPARP